MQRRPLLRLTWPLTIWVAVFGWRAVACKSKGARGRDAKPTAHYHMPPPLPTYTFRPGFTPPTMPPE